MAKDALQNIVVNGDLYQLRAVSLGTGNRDASLTLKRGEAVFTVLVSDTTARNICGDIGEQVKLLFSIVASSTSTVPEDES